MKEWLKAAWARCIRTVAQTAIAAIGTAAILSEVDVRYVLSAAALAGILSILTSLAGLPEVDEEKELEGEEPCEDALPDPEGDDIGEDNGEGEEA